MSPPTQLTHPDRRLPFQLDVIGLGHATEEAFDSIKGFIERELPSNETVVLYGTNSEAIQFFLQVERSTFGDRVEALILDDAIHRQLETTYYRSTRSERPIASRFVVMLCPDSNHTNELKIQDSVKSLLRRFWSLIKPNEQQEIVLVLLNASLPLSDVFRATNPFPTLYISGGKTGSGRMGPSIRALALRAGRELSALNYSDSLRYRRSMNEVLSFDKASSVNWTALTNATDSGLVAQASMVANWYDFIEIHRHPRTSDLLQLPYLDFILLMRDPRDLLVSQMIYMDQKAGLDMGAKGREKFMLNAIEEDIQFICQEFVSAQESPRVFGLRFEDVHLEPKAAYSRLLEWTGWNLSISEDELNHDIQLGSIEHQTAGQYKSGDREYFFAAVSGTSPRRGVIGDWQNHFTEEVKAFFKSVCGDLLIELGYESGKDW